MQCDARDVALRMLDACFRRHAPPAPGLEPFQEHARQRLRGIISHRRGAILADSVGLGKTHVAVALIRDEIEAGGTALVVGPAQLRTHWNRHTRGIERCRWMSHTALSRATRTVAPASLIVVDEAHAFRNPHTRRYAALALVCEQARVLLLSATPVNNSLFDFYHLLRLFAARSCFIDIAVPDLLSAVEAAVRGGTGAELRRVADAVMVRRTRRAVSAWATRDHQARLRFPSRGPIEVVQYDIGAAYPDVSRLVRRVIPALTFPAHGAGGDSAPRELMRLGLLKRLESSHWAFHASVRRHIRLLDRFIAAAADGLLFDPRIDGPGNVDIDGAVQLSLQSITLREWPRSLDRARLVESARRDLDALRELSGSLARGSDRADPKMLRLGELIDGCSAKIVLFTEYQETARGLWRALATRPGVALVHGGDARLGRNRSSRRAVIERFAPIANGARAPRTTERVRLLIATDVLAEGMNLQDAAVVVSYDLPWNPVRLAQRIGRIDRLGSPHERVRAIAFRPDRGVDELLGLMRRIRRKLHAIRIVGGDAPWSLAGARRATRVVDEIDAAGDAREQVYALWRRVGGSSQIRQRCSGDGSAAVAVVPSTRLDGALCCFRTGGEVLLVLTSPDGRPQVGTAACWQALHEAVLYAMGGGPGQPLAGDGAVEAAAVAAEREARRTLRPRRSRARKEAVRPPDGAAGLAGAAVLRWLAEQPGGPQPDELEQADAILRRLSADGPAGADVRIRRLLRASSPDEAVVALASAAANPPSAAKPSAANTPSAVNPPGAESSKTQGSSAAYLTLLAVLLFRRGDAPTGA
ncbi:MAG TPA: helicase-related protein [Longimicrobiales bacterium]|nr:helicase-related protein [Longimicrobiales bacterium]